MYKGLEGSVMKPAAIAIAAVIVAAGAGIITFVKKKK